MTALTQYSRLEATALWRQTPEAQRREVIVSIGDATLVIANINDQALTHWSLAAVVRANPTVSPAVFHPDGDPSETLEFSDDATEMVEAIEKLRDNIAKRRPRKGRLRVGDFAALGCHYPGTGRVLAAECHINPHFEHRPRGKTGANWRRSAYAYQSHDRNPLR